jgi:hypothetical protein
MDKKILMNKITEKVAPEKAIEMVMQAYNTELMTTLLGRLEENKPKMLGTNVARDHLAKALERVVEVCALTD